MASGCLLLFYKNYNVYQIVYIFELEISITSPSFVALHLLVYEIARCIARGCFTIMFTVTIHAFIEKCAYTKFYLDWLLCD